MAGRDPGGVRRIVVGVDGSDHAQAAVRWAVRMATGMGSEVVAVYAIAPAVYFDPMFGAPVIPVELDEEWRKEVRKEFEESWCRPLREAGVSYRTVIDDGRPASVIAKAADETDADIVLVGRRGRGGMAELLLGSVSHELVLHCRRPVLVISSAPKA